ncbi:hypothetical protein FQA39_LY13647 [Lamprigera yunnana]|nr:hypothetical protein FQA39_LY13647 [Lamprigera yunnana]
MRNHLLLKFKKFEQFLDNLQEITLDSIEITKHELHFDRFKTLDDQYNDIQTQLEAASVTTAELMNFDDISKHVRALQNLAIPVAECAPLLYYILMTKLGDSTKSKFIEYKPRSITNLNEIIHSKISPKHKRGNYNHKQNLSSFQQSLVVIPRKISCLICKSEHYITECSEFQALSLRQRLVKITELKLFASFQFQTMQLQLSFVSEKTPHFLALRTSKNTTSTVENEVLPNNNDNVARDTLTTLSCHKHYSQPFLLSTALVKICGLNDEYFQTYSVILNSDNECTFLLYLLKLYTANPKLKLLDFIDYNKNLFIT